MVVQVTPALQEAMDVCERAAQRVTNMEVKLRKLPPSAVTRSMQLEYDDACRIWRNARDKWERLYMAAGGRL